MSSPKFLVLKLKDFKIPLLIILIGAALITFFIIKSKASPTFSPSSGYEDGKYIASITLPDTEMDLIVEVNDHNITCVSLSGLDETSTSMYDEFINGIDYVNTYVTSTQSLNLPLNSNTSSAAILLMDAVKIALSSDEDACVTNTYEKLDLSAKESADNEDIFVDEFTEDDFSDDSSINEENQNINETASLEK